MSTWEGVFLNAGLNIRDVMTPWDFGGSEFYFFNPETGGQCQIILDLPDPPTDPNDPNSTLAPTSTYTPDCASSRMNVQFDRFDTFGVVVLRFTNESNQVAPLRGFNFDWPDPTRVQPAACEGRHGACEDQHRR